jgi:AcrR family transcriptional regulator
MARPIPPERFSHLVEVATRTFIARGYRLTQMADVAEALGVAKGTLYLYVESKEALFDACVRHADGHVATPVPADLPVRTPAAGATVAYVRERLAAEAEEMALVRVVGARRAPADAAGELAAVLSDLYRRVARNRLALKLIDRCAVDYPELAEVWFGVGRDAQQQLLVGWFEARARAGRFRAVNEAQVAAGTVLEVIAFWAMHRHFGPSPHQAVDDAVAERAVIDLLARGVLAPPSATTTHRGARAT